MSEIYKDLEFDKILERVSALSPSEVVAAELLKTEPTANLTDAKKLLTLTEDAMSVLVAHRPDLAFTDILPFIEKAKVGAILHPAELLRISANIRCLRSLKSCVETMDGCDSLKDITAWVRVCDELEHSIETAVENESDLKDSASEKLYGLRKSITRANAKLKERLESFTRQSEISKYLQDNIVTVRAGRYVVPVKSECRSSVKGLVHDVSGTGSTVFIEPFSVVEANNELITLKTEEQIEVERILAELSRAVVTNAHELTEGQRVLTECGIVFAKAEYAKKTNSFRPMLNDSGRIILRSARHPLISEETVVPVDVSLDRRILLISGPNTGGKTVVLKTVGLFALMAASGMFLPTAENSEMCVFNKIFCDIGDAQSIAASLSTFSAHVKNLAYIVKNADGESLVLLDEVGDGTDPDEGAALAVAIIKKILRTGSVAVVTTHFNSVKEFALCSDDVINSCMQFDNVRCVPTYRLINGVSGSSYALETAERMGLDADVISDAKSCLSEEKIRFDSLMRETERLRNEALGDREQCEALRAAAAADRETAAKLKADYERRLAEINENARSLVQRRADEYRERAETIISEMKELVKNADEAAIFAARKAAKQLDEGVPSDTKKPTAVDAPPKASDLTDGTHVYISGLNKEGIVSGKPRGNKALIAIGSIKTEIPISSLVIIKPKQDKKRTTEKPAVPDPENREIMLLGYTVDDAVDEIERLLSDIPPHSTLRIVHGKGTGALGKGIQSYLKKHPKVKSFRYGRYGEGDTGVTIVEIK